MRLTIGFGAVDVIPAQRQALVHEGVGRSPIRNAVSGATPLSLQIDVVDNPAESA